MHQTGKVTLAVEAGMFWRSVYRVEIGERTSMVVVERESVDNYQALDCLASPMGFTGVDKRPGPRISFPFPTRRSQSIDRHNSL